MRQEKTIKRVEPYISASTYLPEITFKAVVLAILLTCLMAAANAYLVLKVGISVSACIPAAVISMAVLKMFRDSNILENNIVQTAASAGETIACALALVIPALIMMGFWNAFPYWLMTSITIVGGLLGVLLSVPLRRAMVVESDLKFPEGVATAEVLKAGNESASARGILFSAIAAATIKFCQTGLQIFADSIHVWGYVGNTVVGVTSGFSLALVGAGYVVGLQVGIAAIVGTIGTWMFAVPLYGALFGLPADAPDAYAAAVGIWSSKIRIVGVGMMLFGGLWMMLELFAPVRRAIASSLEAVRKVKNTGTGGILRTDSDIPITYVIFGLVLLILPIYIIFHNVISGSNIQLSFSMIMGVSIIVTILAFILTAIGSSIAAYMSGLVGMTTMPVSGVAIMATLVVSLVLMSLLGSHINFSTNADAAISAAAITILVATIVGCAAIISGDNLQDLKSGQLVGSTPWKQQVMLAVGVVVSALILAPIFQLLFEAYGIGDVLPRSDMDPAQALSAPKAALMAALSQAIFTQSMDWTMIMIGVVLGIVVLLIDNVLKKRQSVWRLPILAVAIGIYMPFDITTPLLMGGILSFIIQKGFAKRKKTVAEKALAEQRGLLFASGLIAGEALVGIFLAIPFVAYQSTNVFRIVPDAIKNSTDVLGLLVTLGMLYWFYRIASNTVKEK